MSSTHSLNTIHEQLNGLVKLITFFFNKLFYICIFQAYLERARQAREPFLPRLHHSVKGDEVAVWRPTGLRNPFDDPSMQGRISEIEEPTDEEDWQDGTILVYFLDKTFFPHLFEEYKVLGSNILFVEKP